MMTMMPTMTPEEFVEGLRRSVLDNFASDLLTDVKDPPGRKPATALVNLSRWFNSLDSDSAARIAELVDMAAQGAVHGVLCVLDGARVIEREIGPKGHFELKWVKDGAESVLLGPDGGTLHEFL